MPKKTIKAQEPEPRKRGKRTRDELPPDELEASSERSRRHGFYSTVLTGADRVNYDAAKLHQEAELLRESFYVVQAKIRRILSGDGNFGQEEKILIEAMNVLAEEGQLSPEFVTDVRMKLLGYNLDRLVEVWSKSGTLLAQALQIDQAGDIHRRVKVLERFLIDVGKYSQERNIRQLVVTTISLLRLEAGIPREAMEEIVGAVLAEGEEVGEMPLLDGVGTSES